MYTNKIPRVTFLAAFIFGISVTLTAQKWEDLPQPFGGSIIHFEEDAGDLYALTHGGIFKSADAGQHWSLLKESRSICWSASQLEVSEGYLYILTTQGTIERSADQGESWETILAKPYPINGQGEVILHIYADGDTLLVGSRLTVYRSVDRGDTWEKTIDHYAANYRGFGKVNSDYFVSYDRYILKSADAGISWDQVFSAGYNFADFTVVDTIVYALYEGFPRFIRSYDSGQTWDKIDTDTIKFYQYHSDFDDWLTGYGQSVYYGSDYGCIHGSVNIFHSPDAGDEWFSAPWESLQYRRLSDLKAMQGQLLAGTFQGVFRSTDDGTTFSPYHDGMNSTWVRNILKSKNNRCWAETYQGVFSSDDNGQNWTLRFNGDLDGSCDYFTQTLFSTQQRMFFKDGCKVVYSEDNGETWQAIPAFQSWDCPDLIVTTHAAWFSTYSKVYKFSDDESVLVDVTNSVPAPRHFAAKGEIIYLTTFDKSYISRDAGMTWDTMPELYEDSTKIHHYMIGIGDENMWLRSYYIPLYDERIYRYGYESGEYERMIPVDVSTGDSIPEGQIVFFEKTGNIRWMSARGKGLYYTTDVDGEKWSLFTPALPIPNATTIFVDNDDLWAGTAGAGIFRIALNVPPAGNDHPMFSLMPNPSAGNVSLSSDVFFSDPLMLQIFDAAGRLVYDRVLIPGSFWEESLQGLASGMYFWHIKTATSSTVLKWIKSQ
ncbi:MAG: T9SS type A sorting domain-containing protein [Lewinellaceae bacterium]|nr:T9SS type A sorting domain-containing protein [Lewinellaceae bacterium]